MRGWCEFGGSDGGLGGILGVVGVVVGVSGERGRSWIGLRGISYASSVGGLTGVGARGFSLSGVLELGC